jgi:hypothetical protein
MTTSARATNTGKPIARIASIMRSVLVIASALAMQHCSGQDECHGNHMHADGSRVYFCASDGPVQSMQKHYKDFSCEHEGYNVVIGPEKRHDYACMTDDGDIFVPDTKDKGTLFCQRPETWFKVETSSSPRPLFVKCDGSYPLAKFGSMTSVLEQLVNSDEPIEPDESIAACAVEQTPTLPEDRKTLACAI